jgi:hypothetical protein
VLRYPIPGYRGSWWRSGAGGRRIGSRRAGGRGGGSGPGPGVGARGADGRGAHRGRDLHGLRYPGFPWPAGLVPRTSILTRLASSATRLYSSAAIGPADLVAEGSRPSGHSMPPAPGVGAVPADPVRFARSTAPALHNPSVVSRSHGRRRPGPVGLARRKRVACDAEAAGQSALDGDLASAQD